MKSSKGGLNLYFALSFLQEIFLDFLEVFLICISVAESKKKNKTNKACVEYEMGKRTDKPLRKKTFVKLV